MSLDAETVARINDLSMMIWLEIGTIVSLVGALWWSFMKIDAGCSQCAHCQRKARDRAARQKEANDAYARKAGLWTAEDDEETAAKKTRERLFGRQDVAPSEDEPQDREDSGT